MISIGLQYSMNTPYYRDLGRQAECELAKELRRVLEQERPHNDDKRFVAECRLYRSVMEYLAWAEGSGQSVQ